MRASVGTSNLVAGNLKLAQNYSPFKSHFIGALNNALNFLQKTFSTTKIGRFLRRFSVVEFSAVDFVDFKDSTPKITVLVYV